MSFFTSFLKPKEPPRNVRVEKKIITRSGDPYIYTEIETLPAKEIAKMEVITDYSDPPPYKNVKRRFDNRRAKTTYREVYVTPERAAEIKAERSKMREENEAYAPIVRKKIEEEERRRIESRKAANESLGQQLEHFNPRGGKRKTRRVKRKARKTRKH